MQNRTAIWVFTILLVLACAYQLSISYFTSAFEKKAEAYGQEQAQEIVDAGTTGIQENTPEFDSLENAWKEKFLKDSANVEIYLGNTYQDCKSRELSLGLDLEGGMNVTLEVSIAELVRSMAANPDSPEFLEIYNAALEGQTSGSEDFITLFVDAYESKSNPGGLVAYFNSYENNDKFPTGSSDEDVIAILRKEAESAIDGTEDILEQRINQFGVAQPNIQKQEGTGRIFIELPGVKDKIRVRKQLQSTANLEFWEVYKPSELFTALIEINNDYSETQFPGFRDSVNKLGEKVSAYDAKVNADTSGLAADPLAEPDSNALVADPLAEPDSSLVIADGEEEEIEKIRAFLQEESTIRKTAPLFRIMQPLQQSQVVLAYAAITDTAAVNRILNSATAKRILPSDALFMWSSRPNGGAIELYGLKVLDETAGMKPMLDGSDVADAEYQMSQYTNEPEVHLNMTPAGSDVWKDYTTENAGKTAVAIALDNHVLTAPMINSPIPNGSSVISGGFKIEEAQDVAKLLNAGSLPAPARIIQESYVGPSLGAKNISSGMISFGVALAIVLVYMIFYYAMAGIVANIALLANIFFIFGVLASFGAVLTLPGIAGIVLTIGMSVDANVLIYERIREELRAGKGQKLAIADGYKKAYSAIVDANVTTFMTGVILMLFGTGPIKGFAVTLIIGILTSLFSAIFLTRLIFSYWAERKTNVSFASGVTKNWFTNVNMAFIARRKMAYVLSGLVIIGGIVSLTTNGIKYGVEFTGGRTFVAQFDEAISDQKMEDIKVALNGAFTDENGDAASTEVKTIDDQYHIKVTTQYMYKNREISADSIVEAKLESALSNISGLTYNADVDLEQTKVDPTISDDLRTDSIYAIIGALTFIFFYIMIRFSRWQFGLGALVAVFHDILIVLSLFSILYKFMPFTMEMDQAFIAALLTVVGYSINDTVVVFDRIREYLGIYRKKNEKEVINNALNSTLSRTVNTSLSTFLVLVIIFAMGSPSIQGFIFALMIGVVVGTYSSLFIATPAVVDLTKGLAESIEKETDEKEKRKAAQQAMMQE